MAHRLTIKQLRTHHVGPLDLEIEGGECVALSGPSGAGKSLLLRAIADLDAHQGEVRLDGASCAAMRAHEWRRRVGLLPAESQWWGETIGEHFQQVDETLCHELGFERGVMAWEVARCSTGERQRLALLRLVMNHPEVLLLDEPTASLDAENVARVEGVLTRLRQQRGLAVLWVSHDAAQARRIATRHLHIAAGQIEELE